MEVDGNAPTGGNDQPVSLKAFDTWYSVTPDKDGRRMCLIRTDGSVQRTAAYFKSEGEALDFVRWMDALMMFMTYGYGGKEGG